MWQGIKSERSLKFSAAPYLQIDEFRRNWWDFCISLTMPPEKMFLYEFTLYAKKVERVKQILKHFRNTFKMGVCGTQIARSPAIFIIFFRKT